MKGIFEVKTVEIQPGFIHPAQGDANRYNGNRYTYRHYVAKCVYITGLLDGQPARFNSPTILFTQTTGALNHIVCHKQNGWFKVADGKQTEHRGAKMFDGGTVPNFVLDSHSEIVCLIDEGDLLNISYSVKSTFLNTKILNRVRIDSAPQK